MKEANADLHHFTINKREPIRISWHGSDECFSNNKRHVLNALGNGVLSWKRENKSQNLPFNLRFTPLLVPFNSDTSICSNSMSSSDKSTNSEFAFAHIFFVNSGSYEDYRLTVRPEISEWFATLNEANENNWLILFDSAKVNKDKKAKNQLMDKLKSDFSRFQNRIFEFVELSNEKSFAAFSVFLQSMLFTSFELYIAKLNAKALKLKGSLKETSFELHSLVNEQFLLCRFYWNLGLFEVAIAELDALAIFLSDSIKLCSVKENAEMSPQWVKHLRLLPLGRHCTLLGVQMYLNSVEEELSLVKIHAHLLANQFLLSAQDLHNRLSLAAVSGGVASLVPLAGPSLTQPKPKMDDNSLEEDGKNETEIEQGQKEQQLNTLQLRHNAVGTVLCYARETIHRFEEHILLLRANQNATIFNCLLLVWLAELFTFSEYLLGRAKDASPKLCDVSSASAHRNFLLLKKCEAIRHLCTTILSDGSSSDKSAHKHSLAMLRRWLDATSLNVPSLDGTQSPSSTSELQRRQHSALAAESARLFRTFSKMICGAIDGGEGIKTFEHFAQFALMEAIESFERFGWWRNAFLVRQQLAELLIGSAPNEAHALFRHCLCVLLSRHSLNDFFAHLHFEDLVKHFEETADEKAADFKTILFGCFLAVLSLIDRSERNESEIGRWHSKMVELTRKRRAAEGEEKRQNANLMPWPSVGLSWPLSPSICPNVPLPLAIVYVRRPPFVSSPFVRSSSNLSPFSFIVGLHNSLAIPLNDCRVRVRFKAFSSHSRPSSSSALNSFHIAGPKEKGGPFSLERMPATKNEKMPLGNCDGFFELHPTQPCDGITLSAKRTTNCTMAPLQKVEVNGCFFLDSVFVSNREFDVEFVLDYQKEMTKNAKLENIVCYIVGIQPNIQMKCIDGITGKDIHVADANVRHFVFVSGIDQCFSLSISPGTTSLAAPSHLKLSLAQCLDGFIDFLNSDGNWATIAHFPIPPLDAEETHRILVRMCRGIDRLEAHQSQRKERGQSDEQFKIKVEWFAASIDQSHCESVPIVSRFFTIAFRPIFLLSWRTSFLADHTLYHLDISRKDCASSSADALSVDVLPTFVSLFSQHPNTMVQTDCEMLNPFPFKPIVPNSIFRFIWRLPEQMEDTLPVFSHFLEFKYQILTKNKPGKSEVGREHSLRLCIDFPLQKIDYELCARFFSEQSQSVLCRVDQPADLVVSLRSLSKTLSEAETLVVSIEPDNTSNGHFWHCAERHKLARVKESGVGQAIFTVVPSQMGFLPFPLIVLHKYNGFENSSPSRNSFLLNEKCFGERLLVSYRNLASQIQILGPLHGICEETASVSSANTTESTEPKKKSLKTVAKDRLQKLFE